MKKYLILLVLPLSLLTLSFYNNEWKPKNIEVRTFEKQYYWKYCEGANLHDLYDLPDATKHTVGCNCKGFIGSVGEFEVIKKYSEIPCDSNWIGLPTKSYTLRGVVRYIDRDFPSKEIINFTIPSLKSK